MFSPHRRRLVLAAVAASAAPCSFAQDTYPSRPVQLIHGFAAGPFRDKNDPSYWNGDGMFILRADSQQAAAAIADTCPFHASGLRIYRIVP
jgi:hypothetical protein